MTTVGRSENKVLDKGTHSLYSGVSIRSTVGSSLVSRKVLTSVILPTCTCNLLNGHFTDVLFLHNLFISYSMYEKQLRDHWDACGR